MKKKTKVIFIISLVLNLLFTLYIAAVAVAESMITPHALYNAFQFKLCGEDFQKQLDEIDVRWANDPENAHNAKNAFAINVCLMNYKTREKLDIQPLIDQVK